MGDVPGVLNTCVRPKTETRPDFAILGAIWIWAFQNLTNGSWELGTKIHVSMEVVIEFRESKLAFFKTPDWPVFQFSVLILTDFLEPQGVSVYIY